MKAMVLAAGVGSRLRPLTDERPKALLEVGGVPMLEIVIRRLMAAGVDEAIINVFHLADKIAEFLKANGNFGIRIELSRETELLDTGGGLKKAAWFFDDGQSFIVHNVDVYSEADLGELCRFHAARGPLATLAVRSRRSGRRFLFDREGRLCGWESSSEGPLWARSPVPGAERLAFDGIHVASSRIFERLSETGAFSITRAYLRLAAEGEDILACRTDGNFWSDIGRPERLEELRRRIRAK